MKLEMETPCIFRKRLETYHEKRKKGLMKGKEKKKEIEWKKKA